MNPVRKISVNHTEIASHTERKLAKAIQSHVNASKIRAALKRGRHYQAKRKHMALDTELVSSAALRRWLEYPSLPSTMTATFLSEPHESIRELWTGRWE